MKANYLHTAGILVALYVGAACTSKQGVLGVKKEEPSETVSRDTVVEEEKTDWGALRAQEMLRREKEPPIILNEKQDTKKAVQAISLFTGALDKNITTALPRYAAEQKAIFNELLDQLKTRSSFKNFFQDPKDFKVMVLAQHEHPSAKKVRDNFMYELYTRADKKTLVNWFKNAPKNLFAYGPEGDDYVKLFIALTNKLTPLIRATDLRTRIRGYSILLLFKQRMSPFVYSQIWSIYGRFKITPEQLKCLNEDLTKEVQSIRKEEEGIVETCKRLQHDLDDA